MGFGKLIEALSVVIALSGCGGSDGSGAGQGQGGNAIDYSQLQTLSANEAQTATYIREEEKLARDVYLTLDQTWKVNPFATIATQSEQKHMDSMQKLLSAVGLADPVLDNTVGAFTNTELALLYQSLTTQGAISASEGLKVGAYIEELDIQDLQQAIQQVQQGTNQAAVIQTYERLMCGSRNHLRSFVTALTQQGVSYNAQVLPSITVNSILEQPQEQCGKA